MAVALGYQSGGLPSHAIQSGVQYNRAETIWPSGGIDEGAGILRARELWALPVRLVSIAPRRRCFTLNYTFQFLVEVPSNAGKLRRWLWYS